MGALLGVVGTLGCNADDRLIGRVGDPPPVGTPFSPPTLVNELASPTGYEQDPTLTQDELEIFFTRTEQNQFDIYTSTRASVSDPWQTPTRVAELSTTYIDETPEICPDTLTIYFASDRPDSLTGAAVPFRLWLARRPTRSSPFAAPVLVSSLPPAPAGTNDFSPSMDSSGLWFAWASDRGTMSYDLYLASRLSTLVDWSGTEPISQLNTTFADWDPALFGGLGQRIIFASSRTGNGDLFESGRTAIDHLFTAPVSLTELNTPVAEGDPWVSSDGRRIWFFSLVSGTVRIYFSSRP